MFRVFGPWRDRFYLLFFCHSIILRCRNVSIGFYEASCRGRCAPAQTSMYFLFRHQLPTGRCVVSPKLATMCWYIYACFGAHVEKLTQPPGTVATRSRSRSRGPAFSLTVGPVYKWSTRCGNSPLYPSSTSRSP